MELAAVIVFIFVVAIILMVISIPLMIISRIARLLKNSYRKLFTTPARKKA